MFNGMPDKGSKWGEINESIKTLKRVREANLYSPWQNGMTVFPREELSVVPRVTLKVISA